MTEGRKGCNNIPKMEKIVRDKKRERACKRNNTQPLLIHPSALWMDEAEATD